MSNSVGAVLLHEELCGCERGVARLHEVLANTLVEVDQRGLEGDSRQAYVYQAVEDCTPRYTFESPFERRDRLSRLALEAIQVWARAGKREPQELGAVVLDAEGNVWVRADRGTLPWFRVLKDGNGGQTVWRRWDQVPAPTRFLSWGADGA